MGDKVTLHETISDGITVSDERHASQSYSERARRHLWLQMSRTGRYDENKEIPIMVRGEGTRVYDANGTEYFDGLSGLFTNSLGHGRRDIGEAMAAQVGELGFFPLWTYAHPRAIELAERLASLDAQAISIASFSPPVAPRRMRVPGSWPASTTVCVATSTATRSSVAISPTTARPWAR